MFAKAPLLYYVLFTRVAVKLGTHIRKTGDKQIGFDPLENWGRDVGKLGTAKLTHRKTGDTKNTHWKTGDTEKYPLENWGRDVGKLGTAKLTYWKTGDTKETLWKTGDIKCSEPFIYRVLF